MGSETASPEQARRALAGAELLFDGAAVQAAYDRLAEAITRDLARANPLLVCVLQGGVVPFGQILPRLDFPLQVDYVHATRYRDALAGRDLHWIAGPVSELAGRSVLIVDDILDEGTTLAAIEERFRAAGAADVRKAVLATKQRRRATPVTAQYSGLEVPDRYVFGCGMDYRSYWRNLPGIYALGEDR